jgi:hypothetical protein
MKKATTIYSFLNMEILLSACILLHIACGETDAESMAIPADAEAETISNSGLVVVELESNQQSSSWKKGSTEVEGKSITYIFSDTEYFKNPGNKLLEYKIKIGLPGTYGFLWHSKVGAGTSPTDNNDTWLRIIDADDFFAKNSQGSILHPKGICVSDCPNGAGEKGWFKVYSNGTVNWSWRTKTSDKDPHEIYATFNEAGTYTVQISARSANQFLDRFVLYHLEKYSENEVKDLSLPQQGI